MIHLIIPGKPKPKPAGCLKYSHGRPYISMNRDGYMEYCNEVYRHILYQYGIIHTSIQPYGFVYHFIVPNLLRLGDITNCMESLQDCLVKSKLIKNDTPKFVNKVYIHLDIKPNEKHLTNIYLCDKIEFSEIVSRFL